MSIKTVKLTENAIRAIEAVLSKDQRVELIPKGDGGVRVIHVKREEVKAR